MNIKQNYLNYLSIQTDTIKNKFKDYNLDDKTLIFILQNIYDNEFIKQLLDHGHKENDVLVMYKYYKNYPELLQLLNYNLDIKSLDFIGRNIKDINIIIKLLKSGTNHFNLESYLKMYKLENQIIYFVKYNLDDTVLTYIIQNISKIDKFKKLCSNEKTRYKLIHLTHT